MSTGSSQLMSSNPSSVLHAQAYRTNMVPVHSPSMHTSCADRTRLPSVLIPNQRMSIASHLLACSTYRSPHASIDVQQAMIEHNYADFDRLPKLLVRHRKIYEKRTFDTLGQLFPTWLNQSDDRCVHCFTCDQVLTPESFMIHVDDEQLSNEYPSHMSSIQLLTSETLSEYKVEL
jgi:hypothetical protein